MGVLPWNADLTSVLRKLWRHGCHRCVLWALLNAPTYYSHTRWWGVAIRCHLNIHTLETWRHGLRLLIFAERTHLIYTYLSVGLGPCDAVFTYLHRRSRFTNFTIVISASADFSWKHPTTLHTPDSRGVFPLRIKAMLPLLLAMSHSSSISSKLNWKFKCYNVQHFNCAFNIFFRNRVVREKTFV